MLPSVALSYPAKGNAIFCSFLRTLVPCYPVTLMTHVERERERVRGVAQVYAGPYAHVRAREGFHPTFKGNRVTGARASPGDERAIQKSFDPIRFPNHCLRSPAGGSNMKAIPYGASRLVGVNERGNLVGEDHPRAKLSNSDVDRMFEMREPMDGSAPLSYAAIARLFGVSKGHVSDILSDRCRRRAAYPVAFRRIAVKATGHLATPEHVGRVLRDQGMVG